MSQQQQQASLQDGPIGNINVFNGKLGDFLTRYSDFKRSSEPDLYAQTERFKKRFADDFETSKVYNQLKTKYQREMEAIRRPTDYDIIKCNKRFEKEYKHYKNAYIDEMYDQFYVNGYRNGYDIEEEEEMIRKNEIIFQNLKPSTLEVGYWFHADEEVEVDDWNEYYDFDESCPEDDDRNVSDEELARKLVGEVDRVRTYDWPVNRWVPKQFIFDC